MRRTLLITGFALFSAALALCAALYAEHHAAVTDFSAERPAAGRRDAPPPLLELPVEDGVAVRVAASWSLRPDLACDRERLRADLPHVPETLDGLRVVWRERSGGVDRVLGEQRMADAPADGPAGWSRAPAPFLRTAGPAATLRADLEADPDAVGLDRPECWSFGVAGRRTMALRGRDLAVLLAVPLALALLLAGMWRRSAAATEGAEAPPRWRWGDALVPVGLTVAFLALGSLVPWCSADVGWRLLQQAPFTAALGLGVALVAARRRSRSPLAALGGRPSGRPAWIAAGLGTGVLLALPAAWLVGTVFPSSDATTTVLWVPGSVLALAAASSAAALSEELLWRGLVFEVAAARLGAWWAV
ncbi:MAG: hypothetical protein JXB32_02985, partial [Deltaproteobacteria bacterium]|nr:hypothetical protein [Deltaproteobacteria bacterium]